MTHTSEIFRKMKIGNKLSMWLLFALLVFLVTIFVIGYFGAQKQRSYLPVLPTEFKHSNCGGSTEAEIIGKNFKVSVDGSGRLEVRTNNNETILSNLIYYNAHLGANEKWGLDSLTVSLISDSTISIKGKGISDSEVTIILTIPKSDSKLDVTVRTYYNKKAEVEREALVAFFEAPVEEVYKKNRQVDTASFKKEYWLQRQGIRFGRGNRSALVYNPQNVSSLQYDLQANMLFVNLDYSRDHPHIYIPFQEDEGKRWEDQSAAIYYQSEERFNSFSIYFGNLPEFIPRLMSLPNGFLAGYLFTEHADGGDLRVHRAVYFGSDTTTRAYNATGGFVGFDIATTKSVFYANPNHSTYNSIIDDPEGLKYLDFLDQLYATGLYDICLHTPEGDNSSRKMLEESIPFMKGRFDAITWIDHGMYNGKNNRECIVADGLNSKTKYYVADIWEANNTKYFWSPAIEIIRASSQISITRSLAKLKLYRASVALWSKFFSPDELTEMNFFQAFSSLMENLHYNVGINSLSTTFGEDYPTPLYWQHITRTGQFYSWVTDYETDYNRLWKKSAAKYYDNTLQELDQLVNEYGIFINHGYYCRNRLGHDLTIEKDGKVFLNPYFNKLLENMALRRNSGELYITTIRDLMRYWILIENVSFKYLQNGYVEVTNNNNEPIHGLSIIVQSCDVFISGKTSKSKKTGGDTICWFDINPQETVLLKLLN